MCLGIPMQALEPDGLMARWAGCGEERRVNPMPPGAILLATRGGDADHLFADLPAHPGDAGRA